VTNNNDAVYHACAAVFGTDVNIQYYGRGMATSNDASPGGFWQPAWYFLPPANKSADLLYDFKARLTGIYQISYLYSITEFWDLLIGRSRYTMDEIDNRQLAVSLYIVPEVGVMRNDYKTTAAKMLNVSAACAAGNAKRGTHRWCPTQVVPWVSLGAGYRPPTQADSMIKGGRYKYQIPWDYPIWYSWDIGRQINNASLRWPQLSYYEHAKAVALYPSAFDQRSPQLEGGGDLTTMLLHFIAYCRGAAGIERLPAAHNMSM
jgi:hypothetical protein